MPLSSTSPLDIDRIEEARKDAWLGHKIVLFNATASTNDIAWEYAANPSHHGLCVLAESQYKGRGRRGRLWHSKPAQSILASILLLDQSIQAELLTLTAAVATAEAIQAFCELPCQIKWPNDILVDGKKLAGILVEKKTTQQQHHFVVGIGINCNQPAEFFDEYDLNMPATSLAIETGKQINRNELICRIMEKFEQWLQKAQACGANNRPVENPVVQKWLQLSSLLGQHLTIESDNQRYSGFCRGIDPAEGLIVQLDSGAVKIFHANHTSIVKT
ncbi:MAG: biotin--[acetyl-CoA-carboxylase] ligase [Planctomycetes bacterium]|nr:biotin--[acetyl-CoA-carboxylase] ligase [Planctomycetota bacterium]